MRNTTILALLVTCGALLGCASTLRDAQAVPASAPKAPKPLDTVTVLSMLQVYAERDTVSLDFEVRGDAYAAWLPKLEQAITARGLDVVYTGLLGLMGATDGASFIAIEQAQNANSRLSTLLHEYAHVLGCLGTEKAENEVCAETVSFLAARAIRFDTRVPSFNYILFRVATPTVERVLWRDRAKIAGIVRVIQGELLAPSE